MIRIIDITRKKVIGNCCLCGKESKLTFEHLQPESCGNDEKTWVISLKKILEDYNPAIKTTGRKFQQHQKGFGFHTLCSDCNSFCGTHYINEFKKFYETIKNANNSFESNPLDIHFKNIRPLNILKQIIVILISVNRSNDMGSVFKNYILNNECNELPTDHNVYIHLTDRLLSVPFMSQYCNNEIYYFSYFSFPPLGMLLTHNSNPAYTPHKYNKISFFNKYKFNEEESFVLKMDYFNLFKNVIPEDLFIAKDKK